jgi:polyisoprenyl-phosphate glycosyltransferase
MARRCIPNSAPWSTDTACTAARPANARPDAAQAPPSSGGGEPIDLTLVVPCYQEEGHLHRSLDEVRGVLDLVGLRYELVLLDDASRDHTADLIREYVERNPEGRARATFHRQNVGRGGTVAEGIRMASGRYVGFLDIDLEVPPSHIPGALARLADGSADMVVGERREAFRLASVHRIVSTIAYRCAVRILLRTPRLDTEAGFKFFKREAILPILDRTADPGWFWDTEVTVRALDAGLRVCSEPVIFRVRPDKASTVRLLRDGWRSLTRLVAFTRARAARVPAPVPTGRATQAPAETEGRGVSSEVT